MELDEAARVSAKAMIETIYTPSGIRIDFDPEPHTYTVDGEVYPSITGILDVLYKPLQWWGMQIGVKGISTLFNNASAEYAEALWFAIDGGDVEWLVDQLTQHKLTVNHVRDSAGERGTSIHRAFETWATTGELPDPNDYPATEEGYIRGLVKFLTDIKVSKRETMLSEVRVASKEHKFAGTLDLMLDMDECELMTRTTKTGKFFKPQTYPAGCWQIDGKTTKYIYNVAELQTAGYEIASVECGYQPTDYRGVARFGSDGSYEFKQSRATEDHFLNILGAWRTMQDLK
jgi:hypothetical protein